MGRPHSRRANAAGRSRTIRSGTRWRQTKGRLYLLDDAAANRPFRVLSLSKDRRLALAPASGCTFRTRGSHTIRKPAVARTFRTREAQTLISCPELRVREQTRRRPPSLSNREGPASVSGDSWSEGTWSAQVHWTFNPAPATSETSSADLSPVRVASACEISAKSGHDSSYLARTKGRRPRVALRSPRI